MKDIKNIEIKDLGPETVSGLTKAAVEVQPQSDGSKVIGLNFQSSKGGVPDGILCVSVMSKSDTDFITAASGEISLGAILPLACGKFGVRSAESTATFNLFSDDIKAGKSRETLTAEEKNALEILDKLSCGRKSRIKAIMLSGQKTTASEMKSLGLIDVVEGGFVDKYAQARLDSKKKR